jgi:hypothetical protein
MNEGQQMDHAYHEDRLLLLIDQRAKMTADSGQLHALDIEIAAIWDLVRSYRIVKAMQTLLTTCDKPEDHPAPARLSM